MLIRMLAIPELGSLRVNRAGRRTARSVRLVQVIGTRVTCRILRRLPGLRAGAGDACRVRVAEAYRYIGNAYCRALVPADVSATAAVTVRVRRLTLLRNLVYPNPKLGIGVPGGTQAR